MKKLNQLILILFLGMMSNFGYAGNYHDSIPQTCNNVTGGLIINSHTGAQAGAVANGTLTINFFGDLDVTTSNEFIDVLSEKGSFIGQLSTPGAQCGPGNVTFTIPRDSIDAWALDGIITFNYQAGSGVNANICTSNAFCITSVLDYTFESGVYSKKTGLQKKSSLNEMKVISHQTL